MTPANQLAIILPLLLAVHHLSLAATNINSTSDPILTVQNSDGIFDKKTDKISTPSLNQSKKHAIEPQAQPVIKTLETHGRSKLKHQDQSNIRSIEDDQMTKATPDKLLEESIHRIIRFLQKTGATDLSKILLIVDKEISFYFDFNQMSRLTLGRLIHDTSPDQFQKIKQKIRQSFIESIAQNLVNYSFTKRRISFSEPIKSRYRKIVLLRMRISHPQRRDTILLFKFHRIQSGWKIFDALANGQSAVLHYRRKLQNSLRMSVR